MTKPENWHVLGAGAMGCLWAARLLEQGHSCRLLVRQRAQTPKSHQTCTLSLESAGKISRFTLAVSSSSCVQETPINKLLLSCKAGEVISALDSVQHSISPQTRIVLLQNGIKMQRQLRQQDRHNQFFCLATSHGAWLRAPFHVVHAGVGKAWLGQLPRIADTATDIQQRTTRLLQSLPASTMQLGFAADIEQQLWLKFAINCAINALTVIHDCQNGELLSAAHQPTLSALCAETETILAGCGHSIGARPLLDATREVLQATAANYSSSLQDARRGRALELAHFNGYLCELADGFGLTCEHNRSLLRTVETRLQQIRNGA
ncbi:MAG: 2-dehydropantoate 2-reductase [Pseudomonadales bacterium]|nr:2-dehydropantoate 2-reductase [Pseudomonadales bacterium]